MAITSTAGLMFLGAAGGYPLLALGYNTVVGRPEIGLLNAAVFGIEAAAISEVTTRALKEVGSEEVDFTFQWALCHLLTQYASQAIGYLPLSFVHAGYLAIASLISLGVLFLLWAFVVDPLYEVLADVFR